MSAQDPYFSLYAQNPLMINPAFAGSVSNLRICSGYRNQWPALFGNAITYAFSSDYYFPKQKLGMGLNYFSESSQIGNDNVVKNYRAGLDFAHRLYIEKDSTKGFMQLGIEYAYGVKSQDTNSVNCLYACPYDYTLKADYHDLSFGILFYRNNFCLGLAAYHVNQPEIDFTSTYKLPVRYVAHAAKIFRTKDSISTYFEPRVFFYGYQYYNTVQIGFILNRGPVFAGVDYRTNDSFIFTLGFHTKRVSFAYSYDLQRSYLNNERLGSHELSFQIRLLNKKQDQSLGTIGYL